MTSEHEPTRRAHARRACSTICIAMIVARLTPVVALVQPAPSVEVRTLPDAQLSTGLQLTAHLCTPYGACGSATATLSVVPRDAPQRDAPQW
jgi:hypothetical protein